MNKLALVLLAGFIRSSVAVSAQTIDDKFFRENLLKTSYDIDTEAETIVLYEKGEHRLIERGHRYDDEFHVHRIIKVLNSEVANDVANVKFIYHYEPGKYEGYADRIKARTYNLVDGQVVVHEMDRAAIYDKAAIKNAVRVVSFTLPEVKQNSIIEYEYEVSKGLFYDLAEWEFQGDYPKLLSEFQLTAFNNFLFNAIGQGNINFKEYNRRRDTEGANVTAYKITEPLLADNRYTVIWGLKNIAALKEESCSPGVTNYRQLLQIQSSPTTTRSANSQQDIKNGWANFDEYYMKYRVSAGDDEVGRQVYKSNNFLADIVESLVKNEASPVERAKAIFNFVRSNFTCVDDENVFIKSTLKKVFDNKEGNIAEINLLLTSMLSRAKFEASPVVLSAVGELKLLAEYPVVQRMNHMISMVTIDSTRYLLDATDKFSGFGHLSADCYNGYAHIINDEEKDEKNNDLMLTPTLIRERKVIYVNVTQMTDSGLTMELSEKIGRFESAELREEWSHDEGKKTRFFDSQISLFPSNTIVNDESVDNMDNIDTNLVIKYKLSTRFNSSGLIYFNADLVKVIAENQFTAKKRKLPIQFPYREDYNYILNMHIPSFLQPVDLPEPINIRCGGKQMTFRHEVSFDSSSRVLSVHANFTTGETIFPAEMYDSIRMFFAELVKNEGAVLALKKLM